LDAYANGFNRSLGGGWSRAGGNLIHQGLVGTGAMKNSTLANATANQCLAGTAVVAAGAVLGGEAILGVGTGGACAGSLAITVVGNTTMLVVEGTAAATAIAVRYPNISITITQLLEPSWGATLPNFLSNLADRLKNW
jgi:hypothetical protein